MCARKQTRRSVSIRGTTYARLRDFCDARGESMSEFVEARIAEFMAAGGDVHEVRCSVVGCTFVARRCSKHGGADRAHMCVAAHRSNPASAAKHHGASTVPLRVPVAPGPAKLNPTRTTTPEKSIDSGSDLSIGRSQNTHIQPSSPSVTDGKKKIVDADPRSATPLEMSPRSVVASARMGMRPTAALTKESASATPAAGFRGEVDQAAKRAIDETRANLDAQVTHVEPAAELQRQERAKVAPTRLRTDPPRKVTMPARVMSDPWAVRS